MNIDLTKSKILSLKSVDSTNEFVKRSILNGEAFEGYVVTAESQTNGKGRLGRPWFTYEKDQLSLSIVLPKLEYANSPCIVTLIIGLAVANAIRACTNIDAFIKWPNDIVINNKKVCGILCEHICTLNKKDYIIAGIGININNKTFPLELEPLATSLYLECLKTISHDYILKEILKQISFYYSSNLEINNVLEQYKHRCITLNKEIKVKQGNRYIQGKAIDIDSSGELLLKTAEDKVIKISHGDITKQ